MRLTVFIVVVLRKLLSLHGQQFFLPIDSSLQFGRLGFL
jgi:hypothetical protein